MSSQTHESIDDRPTVEPFPSWPVLDEEMVDAVSTVLRSGRINYWTGNEGRQFEAEYAAHVGVDYAIAAANGTVTLDMALHALHIGAEDEVIVTPRSFIASASCVLLRGATPVFADVDRDSQNLTAETIAPVLTGRTKAIILVHLAGWPCEMDGILALAEDRGLAVIEDCAQAHGALYRGRPVGSMGVIGSFSFCQDKILTTGGEGGMVTTARRDLWESMWAYKDHGKRATETGGDTNWSSAFRWVRETPGTNYRLTEMQAAIGRVMLQHLPEWVAKRRANAAMLHEGLGALPGLRVSIPPAHIHHSYYKYYLDIVPDALRSDWSRDRIIAEVNRCGVPCFTGSCPEIYLEKAFDGFRPTERLPVARELGETSMMLLVHPTLGPAEMDRTIEALRATMREAMR